MVSLSEVFDRYSRHPLHFIAPMLFAFILSIAALFTSIGLYLFTSMLFTAFQVPTSRYLYALGFFLALFILSLAGFKAAIIKGFEVALKGKRIKLMEFLKVAKAYAFPMLLSILIRLLLWALALAPTAYLLYNGVEGLPLWASALFSLFLILLFEYLLLPQFSLLVNLELPLLSTFPRSLSLAIRHWKVFFPLFLLLGLNFLLKWIPLLQLLSFFLLYPVAYATLVGRVLAYGRR